MKQLLMVEVLLILDIDVSGTERDTLCKKIPWTWGGVIPL